MDLFSVQDHVWETHVQSYVILTMSQAVVPPGPTRMMVLKLGLHEAMCLQGKLNQCILLEHANYIS